MNSEEVDEIIDFINKKYDKEVPGPVKFVVRRKAKKLTQLDLDDFPDSFRKCTIEELIVILNRAYSQGKLKF